MVSKKIHPALANIARANRKIVLAYKSGEMSAEVARAELGELVVGDDTGVLWTMDAGGSWLMRNKSGEWVPGVPPRYGLLPPTPEQLGGVVMPGSEVYLAPLELLTGGPLSGLARAGAAEGSSQRSARALLTAVRVVLMSDLVMRSRVEHFKARVVGMVGNIFNR